MPELDEIQKKLNWDHPQDFHFQKISMILFIDIIDHSTQLRATAVVMSNTGKNCRHIY